MMKIFFLTLTAIVIFSGCGKVKEVQDGATIDQPTTPAANCIGLSENDYGCYGADVVFHGKKIVNGVWSVYTQSNVQNAANTVFYDRYQTGYEFRSDGTAFSREQTGGYSYFREWGVDDAGTTLTLSDANSYIYKAVFASDANCFEVTRDGATVKFCNESFVDTANENGAGYYGGSVKFGNLTNYNFTVAGTWTIGPYGSANTAPEKTVVFDANGTTSTGGEWGVSEDGKVIRVDGIGYLTYQYLKSPDSNCIATFELSGDAITSTTWKLCKQ